jgi:hypothetical protein
VCSEVPVLADERNGELRKQDVKMHIEVLLMVLVVRTLSWNDLEVRRDDVSECVVRVPGCKRFRISSCHQLGLIHGKSSLRLKVRGD